MSGFERGARAQKQALKKTAAEILTKQGRLLVRDLVAFTPPTAGRLSLKTSHAAVRKIGIRVLRRDIDRSMKILNTEFFLNNTITSDDVRDRLKELLGKTSYKAPRGGVRRKSGKVAELGNRLAAINAIMQNIGLGNRVALKVNRSFHQRARGKRGRVSANFRNATIIIDDSERSLERYKRSREKDVGQAKAGWAPGARKVGYKLPGWISRHSTPGFFLDHRARQDRPSITFSNRVGWRRDFNIPHIVNSALKNRERSMRLELRHLARAAARAHAQRRG